MPNIASALREEVVRLARKEIRKEVETGRKASAQYRRQRRELPATAIAPSDSRPRDKN